VEGIYMLIIGVLIAALLLEMRSNYKRERVIKVMFAAFEAVADGKGSIARDRTGTVKFVPTENQSIN